MGLGFTAGVEGGGWGVRDVVGGEVGVASAEKDEIAGEDAGDEGAVGEDAGFDGGLRAKQGDGGGGGEELDVAGGREELPGVDRGDRGAVEGGDDDSPMGTGDGGLGGEGGDLALESEVGAGCRDALGRKGDEGRRQQESCCPVRSHGPESSTRVLGGWAATLQSREMPTYAMRPRSTWQLPRGAVAMGERTLLMGILNVTPDSFSDGGRHGSVEAAVRHGLTMLEEGADLLDVGAESTRPKATPLGAEEEMARLLPVLLALRRARPEVLLSVDTYHAATAEAALAAGADVINDVSGLLWDGAMGGVLARAVPAPGVVLMHTRGRPGEWTAMPPLEGGEVVAVVREDLRERLAAGLAAGLEPEAVMLDPGFGFGKWREENLALLAGMGALEELGRPLLIGLSRKGFLVPASSRRDAGSEERLHATIAANTAAILAGAHALRVHDVAAARAAASIADRLLGIMRPSG